MLTPVPKLPLPLVLAVVCVLPAIVLGYTAWPAAMDATLNVQRSTGGLITQTLLLALGVLAVVLGLLLGLGRFAPEHLGLRWRDLGPALRYAVWVVVLTNLLAVVIAAFEQGGVHWSVDWTEHLRRPIGRWLGQFLGNALLEEVLWRAFLIPQLALWLAAIGVLSQRRRTTAAVCLAAVLFALSHVPMDLAHGLSAGEHFGLFAARFASGVMFSIVWLRTGNLLIVVACHGLMNHPGPIVETGGWAILSGAIMIGTLVWALICPKCRSCTPRSGQEIFRELDNSFGLWLVISVLPLTAPEIVTRVGAALVCGALVGLERERKRRPAGFRTMILISLGCCGFVLIGHESVAAIGQEAASELPPGAPIPGQAEISRVLQGLMGGIGFVGAGAVLQSKKAVRGITTAAAVWVVAALGSACGLGFFRLAIILSVATLFTLVVLEVVEDRYFPELEDGNGWHSDRKGGSARQAEEGDELEGLRRGEPGEPRR